MCEGFPPIKCWGAGGNPAKQKESTGETERDSENDSIFGHVLRHGRVPGGTDPRRRLRAGAKPPRPFCPASDFGGRKRVAPMDGVPRVETVGTHLACRDVRGCGCGEKRRGGLPARVPGRLTPQECLRLQGWKDERIDLILSLHSDTQLYKQAGNGVTVNVVEAIGKRLAALHREVTAID